MEAGKAHLSRGFPQDDNALKKSLSWSNGGAEYRSLQDSPWAMS